MITAASPDPHLCSTSVVEDALNHDDITGIKLSYAHDECFFTILLSTNVPKDHRQDDLSNPDSPIKDLIMRYNEACTWTERDKTIEDVDKRLDPIWAEAEDLVKRTAFKRIKSLGRQYGSEVPIRPINDRPPKTLANYLYPKSFNLQLVPEGGGMNVICRPDLPPSLPFAVESDIPSHPGLISVRPQSLQILQLCRSHILKVKVKDSVFCCKLNNAGGQNSFLREFETLLRLRSRASSCDIKVPWLRGIVEVEDGVIGLLTDWIDTNFADLTMLLDCREQGLPHSIRQKWVDQVSQTLRQLHTLNITWGDAKTSNVLIDEYLNAWLVDFGGGFTRGWVDEALYDTQAGDLQGLENTILDILGKR